MTVRNLEFLLKPRSVALVGATSREGSVGRVTARNLLAGGFAGPIRFVNAKGHDVLGHRSYPDVAGLPEAPDLAVIATPPASVPRLIAELGARGTKAVVVITAGFGGGAEGRAAKQAMLDAARPHLLRIVGPNCLGVLVPATGLNASFAHLAPPKGRIAFLSQSGAIVGSVIDWAVARGIGFSHLLSMGEMADVDFGDLLDYLAADTESSAILLYIEAVTGARKFMSAARRASRSKPVIAIKAGRRPEGARAVASHTGALAGADAVYEAALRRAGVLRVFDLDELFAAVQTLASAALPAGERLAILTNGGGMGILATDALIDQGGHLADLSEPTRRALDAVLPPTWSRANPVDIIGDAPGRRYGDAMAALLADPEVDAILALNCPTAITSSADAARAVVEALGAGGHCVLTSWVGEATAREARQIFAAAGLPSYDTPEQAVRGFMHVVRYRRVQQMLMETPPSIPEDFTADPAAARRVIEAVLADGRDMLTGPESQEVIAAYAIPGMRSRVAASPPEAGRIAGEIARPVAIKILSPDISHKSDVGGVILGVAGAAEAERVTAELIARVAAQRPKARITGVTVEPMITSKGAHELIVGMIEDPQFGPVLLFGQGGTAVEVVGDRALALPPLNMSLAHALMRETRVHKLLQGYRDRPPAALDAIALTLIKLSQLVADLPEVAELDINPLLADAEGVMALDARIKVRPAESRGTARFAIRPYPRELEEAVRLQDGRALLLRPVRPEDEPALRHAFSLLSPESIRMRFFAPLKEMSHTLGARLTQIDYDREMALVLTDPAPADPPQMYGVVRISADPDNEAAEYAVIVRDDMTGQGLGEMLMRRIIAYARQRGIGRLYGDVLSGNDAMLALCRRLGFTISEVPLAGTVRVTLSL
jgi:acetyltransferase